jgi:serine/threonine protein kinase
MSLEPGVRLGSYEVVAPIGAGGMGEVYKARDTKLDRDVAVKVLPEHLAKDPDALARFEREAKAVAALSHPNILAIHDFGTHEGTAYAVAELLEGETLRARLEESGALAPKKVVQIAADIARGLAAAHDKSIVHRDLKPENVFLTTDGQVKILDFGLAKQLVAPTDQDAGRTELRSASDADQASVRATSAAEAATELQTDPGMVMGTVGYMAPEQVRGHHADARSDIFALGCVLFEMATGGRAFQRETNAETMTAILREEPPELATDGRTVSPALDEVVRHCLEKRPEERFQSARDLAFALRALSGSQTTSGRAAVAAPDDVTGGRRRVLPWVAMAALVVAAFLAGRLSIPNIGPAATPVAFEQLTDAQGVESEPTLSPDGRNVAYVSQETGNADIFLLRVGGRNPTPLTVSQADDNQPAFSPDGEQIAFRSTRDGGGVFLMGSTGESITRLTDFGFNPSWSPDGREIGSCWLSKYRIVGRGRRDQRAAARGQRRRCRPAELVTQRPSHRLLGSPGEQRPARPLDGRGRRFRAGQRRRRCDE